MYANWQNLVSRKTRLTSTRLTRRKENEFRFKTLGIYFWDVLLTINEIKKNCIFWSLNQIAPLIT